MPYGFRLKFRFSPNVSFEEKALREPIILKIGESKNKIFLREIQSNSKHPSSEYQILGEMFESEAEARSFAEELSSSVLIWSCISKHGLDLGYCGPAKSHLTDHGKEWVRSMFGIEGKVQEDQLGVVIYEIPRPRFAKFRANGTLSLNPIGFRDVIEDVFGKKVFATENAELAASFLASSGFESNAFSRFILLFVSIEAMLEDVERVPLAKEHAEYLIRLTKTCTTLPSSDRASMLGTLQRLKNLSIKQTGMKLAESLLDSAEYGSKPAPEFFKYLYKLRNDLVHNGKGDIDHFNILNSEVERFVRDLVLKQIEDQ